MKKLIVGLVAVLLLFGAFTAVNQKNMPAAASPVTPAPSAAVTPDATPAPPAVKGLDYAAIRALHGADETAITLEGETLDWGFYADFLRTNGVQYEDYFKQMAAYYGIAADWNGSVGDGSGRTYAQSLQRDPGKLHGHPCICQGEGREPRRGGRQEPGARENGR